MNVGWGGGSTYNKYVHNKPESEFCTCQAEYSPSCEHLEFCLAMERSMIKFSNV